MTTTNPTDIVKHYRPIEALVPAEWQQGYISANGIQHHYYRTGGHKPPLVLLHGFMEGALSWLSTAKVLAHTHDVIMPDTRGHGRSDRIGTKYENLLADDAAGVIQALVPEGVHLLGFSQGAGTAIQVADRYPQLVKSLIVAGWADSPPSATATSAPADMTQNEGYMAWFNRYLAWLTALKSQSHTERMQSALAQTMPGTPLLSEDDYVAWVECAAQLDLNLVNYGLTLWSKVGEETQRNIEVLTRLRCPVLMLKSGLWATPGATMTIQAEPSTQPNIKILRFVNAGHLIHRDHPTDFLRVVQEFLQAQP